MKPGEVERIPVPLTPADLRHDPGASLGTVRLTLRAEGWSPFALAPGDDYRWLGVRLLVVRQAGVLLYPR